MSVESDRGHDRNQRAAAILLIVLSLSSALLFFLPVRAGYRAAADRGQVFLGFIRSDDYHRYGSFMEQARIEGRFLFYDRSAVERQSPRLLGVYFWLLGTLANLTGTASITMWHAFAPLDSLLFAASLYFLFQQLFPRGSIAAALLVFLSSGCEWLAAAAGWQDPRPLNSWMDGFSMFSLHHNPLKVLALALVVLLLNAVLRARDRGGKVAWAGIPVLILLLWGVHPNTAIVAYAAAAGGSILELLRRPNRQEFGWIVQAGLVSAPAFAVTGGFILWMQRDPILAHIVSCYQLPGMREPLANFPIRYGALLLFAAPGLFFAWRERRLAWSLIIAWTAAAILCSQNKYLTGILFQQTVHTPLALLGALTITRLAGYRKWRTASVALLLVLLAVSIAQNALTLRQAIGQTAADVWPTSLYLDRGAANIVAVLAHLPKGAVLANRDIGNKVGYLAGQHAFLGHWGTTPDRKTKEQLFDAFVRDPDPDRRGALLDRYGLKYLIWGPREQAAGQPPAPDLMRPIKRNAGYVLFERIYSPRASQPLPLLSEQPKASS